MTKQELYDINIEGTRGVENLSKLVRELGYRDPFSQLSFSGGCFGDLLCFLEDNPGAIEKIIMWIGDNYDLFDDSEKEFDDEEDME